VSAYLGAEAQLFCAFLLDVLLLGKLLARELALVKSGQIFFAGRRVE